MKKSYYVNKNAQYNGDHEVHAEGCMYMPAPANAVSLGEFSSCQDAVKEAKKQYAQVNGFRTCSPYCHTS